MKQLTLLFSVDLSEQVRQVLIRAGIEGFLRVPNAIGSKPGATWKHGRSPEWRAEMIVAAAAPEAIERVVDELKTYANKCEVEPCLRVLVSHLDAVY